MHFLVLKSVLFLVNSAVFLGDTEVQVWGFSELSAEAQVFPLGSSTQAAISAA